MVGHELQAMINILKEALCFGGIYHEIMAAFALHLGAEYVEKLFAVLGRKIDCSNMTKTMLMLKRKQDKIASVDEVIQEVGNRFNACEYGVKWTSSEKTNIIG